MIIEQFLKFEMAAIWCEFLYQKSEKNSDRPDPTQPYPFFVICFKHVQKTHTKKFFSDF